MLIVNIGLPKTGTTTLQKYVYPMLENIRPGLQFNNSQLIACCKKHHLFGLNDNERAIFDQLITERNNFLSLEGLVGWNPHYWQEFAEKNLELFGSKAVIVLVLRDAQSYLTSIYQQRVHEGNIISPKRFFVNQETWQEISKQNRYGNMQHFNVDALCFRNLAKFYSQRFDSVYITSTSVIENLSFIRREFQLTELEHALLSDKLRGAKPQNVSYSDMAMKLTMLRDMLFRSLGGKTASSVPDDLVSLFEEMSEMTIFGTSDSDLKFRKFGSLGFIEKLHAVPSRIGQRLQWRYLMQDLVGRWLPYSKYVLPEDVYVNRALMIDNAKFIDEITQHERVSTKNSNQ